MPRKSKEQKKSPDMIWSGDYIMRRHAANRLTFRIKGETEPLVISLNGDWGAGKTFLLERWKEELEVHEGYRIIYFNAWEDDNLDDPLIAIIGQLSTFLGEDCVKRVLKCIALPSLKGSLNAICQMSGGGNAVEKTISDIEDAYANTISAKYAAQRNIREELQKNLKEMADGIKKKTGKPLIFIIDELDRCRPTFAIELLERVKHIFNIRNIIFVFGINRDQLMKSVESVYGDVDADVYLRRFFDADFLLPKADLRHFSRELLDRHKIKWIFKETLNHQELLDFFPIFCSCFDKLSLRDVERCIKAMIFIQRGLVGKIYISPLVTSTLLVLKLVNPILYKEFIAGKRLASDVINYITESIPEKKLEDLDERMNDLEADFYNIQAEFTDKTDKNPRGQLNLLMRATPASHPEYLARRTLELDVRGRGAQAKKIADLMQKRGFCESPPVGLFHLCEILELTGENKIYTSDNPEEMDIDSVRKK